MQPVLDLFRETLASPWIYLVLVVVTAIDGFIPVVPAEAAVTAAGVFAATGHLDLAAVIGATTAGALAGDHVSYALGRASGARRLERLPAGSRRRATSEWARQAVGKRGGLILLTGRYLPGGRTAVTLTMGAVRYSRRAFLLFDSLAALSWALYATFIGFFGGLAFQREPIKGVQLGLGVALAVALIAEVVRLLRRRKWARAGN